MNTHFLCFGDTCSVHKHQISTLISWSIDIPRDLVDKYLNSPPSAPFQPRQIGEHPIDDWVVVLNIFYFHPYLWKIPNLSKIFQMG